MRRSKYFGVALLGLLVVAAISVAAGSGRKPAQQERANLLFKAYPDLERAYRLSQELKDIYDTSKTKVGAQQRLRIWYRGIRDSELQPLLRVAKTIARNEGRILDYFPHRITNAFAESLNAQLKRFQAVCRGVRETKFFLFRVSKYFSPPKLL